MASKRSSLVSEVAAVERMMNRRALCGPRVVLARDLGSFCGSEVLDALIGLHVDPAVNLRNAKVRFRRLLQISCCELPSCRSPGPAGRCVLTSHPCGAHCAHCQHLPPGPVSASQFSRTHMEFQGRKIAARTVTTLQEIVPASSRKCSNPLCLLLDRSSEYE